MPFMERVREIGADEARLTEDEVGAARMVLSRELARRTRGASAQRSRRRRWTGIGVGALVGGAAVTALVVGSVVAPVDAPSAAAAEVLNTAAETTQTAFAVGPGQYIRIQSIESTRVGRKEDPSFPGGVNWDSITSDTQATIRTTRSLYVPADQSGDWVEDMAEGYEIVDATGPHADKAQDELQEFNTEDYGTRLYPAGRIQLGEQAQNAGIHYNHRNDMDCFYDEMPRDPQALLDWITSYQAKADDECPPPSLVDLGDPEKFDLAPADLRATMFQALALLKGASVESVDGDITTIAFAEDSGLDLERVSVDTARGLIVGRGSPDGTGKLLPSTTVYNITVVDEIPASVVIPQDPS